MWFPHMQDDPRREEDMERTFKSMDGNTAAAYVSYEFT